MSTIENQSPGEEQVEQHSEVQELLKSSGTYTRKWLSPTNNKWYWVVQFPDERVHNYSGSANTEEQADIDITLSAWHYIFICKKHIF